MKILTLFNIFFLNTVLLFSANGENTKQVKDVKACITTPENKPSKNLKALFDYFKIQNDGTLADMAEKAQNAWSWVSSNNENMNDKMDDVKPLINSLELIDSVDFISQKSYKYALVFSGYSGATSRRLHYLADFWKNGIKFEKIIILSGERDLGSNDWDLGPGLSLKKSDKIVEHCKTEYDLTKVVYDQLDLPKDFKALPVVFVNTPKKKLSDGSLRFHYPEDKINCWLETSPEPGDCLAVINQPYVLTLDTLLHNLLPADFKVVNTVGYAISQQHHSVSMWLGAISWWLYEECIRPQLQKN